MLEAIRTYLLAVTAAALLCGVVQSLLPEGAAGRVCVLSCTLLLFLVVAQPVGQLDGEVLLERWHSSLTQWGDYPEEVEETSAALTESIIISRSEAYISSRATAAGLDCHVRVMCENRSGIPVPVRTEVTGVLTRAEQEQLRRIIAADFGEEMTVAFVRKE